MVKKVIFRLTIEGKTPSTWELPQTSVMGIKEGKGKKFIEYYPGEDSCFVEDIQAKNKDLKPERVPLFQYNAQTKQTELAVDASNLSLINYLQTHPWFGLKFGIYSKEKEAQDSLSEFEDVEKALDLIKDSDEIKTKATSMAVFGLNSFYKSFTQCAAELKAKAIKEPKVIIEAISASNYETKFVAGLALVSEIIKINATHTAIVWTENDGVILHIAQGENGLDKLTNFLTNETKEAQILLQEFNTRLERKERMIARSSDADKVISEKDAEIAELKRKLAASKI
jgi:putative ubiquitin-RnfH superfamily antitoxin RatB of RatAB toxin-antitoxin module